MRQAIVALYDRSDSTAEKHYLACGVFIATSVVLTVKHVFDGRGKQGVFVRPFGAQAAYPIHADPTEHPELDAAWFRLDQMPPDATFLHPDLRDPLPIGSGYVLNGYFEGNLSADTPRAIASYEPTLRRYLVEPSHGRGLSGGALCRDGRVCALATDRYTEVSANRGCFVAMHQLQGEFLANALGQRPSLQPAPQLVDVPDPLLAEARRCVGGLFSQDPLRTWSWAQPLTQDHVPPRFARLFDGAVSPGEALLGLLVDELLPAMHRDVDDGELVIDRMAARRLRRKFFSAVETAAKLCLNPRQREAFAAMRHLVKLPASHETSASLALRTKPLDTLAPRPGSPHRITHDRKSVWLGLEGGVGLDQRLNIASLVASAIAKGDQPDRVTEIRSESELRDLTSYLLQERDRGQGYHLLVGNSANTSLDPALLDWLDESGLRVVQLAGGDDGFFLIAEARLVGKINAVVAEFSTRVPWKDIDAPA